MMLSALAPTTVTDLLRNPGLELDCGPFRFRIRSDIPAIARGLVLLYADYPAAQNGKFVDFDLELKRSQGIRRFWRPQVRVRFDGMQPFEPLPIGHAFPQLEWAMNWCISTQAHQYLLLHSAVLERDGMAVILPAPPGSGKSTLCAGLASRGWRLLSDEIALISLASDRLITPLARPISLKNQSLDVIKTFVPDAIFNEVSHETAKGSVTHMKVQRRHLEKVHEKAQPRWIVFPRYVANAPTTLVRRSKAQSLLELGRNAFNYVLLGLTGFEALSDVIDACDCYDFRYSELSEAIEAFDGLARDAGAAVPSP